MIQPEAKDLIVATHGRGIYKADIAQLQSLTPTVMAKDLHVFDLENIKHSNRWGSSWSSWRKANTPGLDLTFFSAKVDTFTAGSKNGRWYCR